MFSFEKVSYLLNTYDIDQITVKRNKGIFSDKGIKCSVCKSKNKCANQFIELYKVLNFISDNDEHIFYDTNNLTEQELMFVLIGQYVSIDKSETLVINKV